MTPQEIRVNRCRGTDNGTPPPTKIHNGVINLKNITWDRKLNAEEHTPYIYTTPMTGILEPNKPRVAASRSAVDWGKGTDRKEAGADVSGLIEALS